MKLRSSLIHALTASSTIVASVDGKTCRPRKSGLLSQQKYGSSATSGSTHSTSSATAILLGSNHYSVTTPSSLPTSSGSSDGTETQTTNTAEFSPAPTNATYVTTSAISSSISVTGTDVASSSLSSLSSGISYINTNSSAATTTAASASSTGNLSSSLSSMTSIEGILSSSATLTNISTSPSPTTNTSMTSTTASTSVTSLQISDILNSWSVSVTISVSTTSASLQISDSIMPSSTVSIAATASGTPDVNGTSSSSQPITSLSVTASSTTSDAIVPTSISASPIVSNSTISPSATSSLSTSSTGTTSDAETSTFNAANYTYYEVTMPITFSTTYDAVATPTTSEVYSITPTATVPCIINESNMASSYQLVYNGTNGNVPLIAKDGHLRVLQDSDFPNTTETDNLNFYQNLPTFHFEPSSNGSNDSYHLVGTVNGGNVYVALNLNTNEVVTSLTSSDSLSSTGSKLVTNIFSFSCNGRLVVSNHGTVFTWQTGLDDVATIMTANDPSETEQILLVPFSTPAGPVSARSTHPDFGAMPNLERRISPYTDGYLPRVPWWTNNMVSRPRAGVRPMEYNGCGSGSTASYVPQLGFGQCCDMHDYCYDNCQGGQVELCKSDYCAPGEWERCNWAFWDCMHSTVCEQISWWHPINRAKCELEALFYAAVVSGPFGAIAFEAANSDRCGVVCQANSNQFFCDNQCMDLHQSDNNNCGGCHYQCATGYHYQCESGTCVCTADILNDSDNCGNCGWKCPYKTHCGGGTCKCNDDQCGNLCVDLKSHPRNCGTCGNVCKTGYCFQGQCVDASGLASPTGPPQCLPTDAIKNGGFDAIENGTGLAPPWQFDNRGLPSEYSIVYGPSDMASSPPDVATVYGENINGQNRYLGLSMLKQNITLCPGANYELTFTLGGKFGKNFECEVEVALMDKTLGFTELPVDFDSVSPMKGYGPYPFTVPAAPAGGGSGWGPNDDFRSIEYDSTGTFAYAQIQFFFVSSEIECPGGFMIDDVSVYQV